ncbi:phosphatase PAP2 family protein [Chryseolinea sp. H1M3-3]|uniref:phosphatase PAP2 family protein n=1 Tax=Chryseolinea sp. H1M3-3 TaxID=3034144 RepID=UPI0023ED8587|nr:phosphatase PAP2 family protein [Chryseolinea sp. H1M3-3]
MLIIRFTKAVTKFLREKFNSQNENLPFYITIIIAFIIFIICLNAFIELTDELSENELEGFDSSISKFIHSFRNDTLTAFFRVTTHFGDRLVYFILIILLAAYFFIGHKSWKFIIQTMLVLGLSSLSNIVLKKYFNRSRPSLDHLIPVHTLSYPSGHAMSAMAFYGFLIYLSLRYVKGNTLKITMCIFLSVIILIIGLSRIYLGVHYPSDVLAGFIGGGIWIAFCALIFNVIDLWMNKGKGKAGGSTLSD